VEWQVCQGYEQDDDVWEFGERLGGLHAGAAEGDECEEGDEGDGYVQGEELGSGWGMGCWSYGLGEYITFFFFSLTSTHAFPLTPSVLRCSTRHPAKNSASPSKSSILVTLDTSVTAHHQHTPQKKKTGGEDTPDPKQGRRTEGKLTLIRPNNNHGPCTPNSIPTVRMPVAGVVVRVVDEDLVEVCGVGACVLDRWLLITTI
jgi:hypothetical protein